MARNSGNIRIRTKTEGDTLSFIVDKKKTYSISLKEVPAKTRREMAVFGIREWIRMAYNDSKMAPEPEDKVEIIKERLDRLREGDTSSRRGIRAKSNIQDEAMARVLGGEAHQWGALRKGSAGQRAEYKRELEANAKKIQAAEMRIKADRLEEEAE